MWLSILVGNSLKHIESDHERDVYQRVTLLNNDMRLLYPPALWVDSGVFTAGTFVFLFPLGLTSKLLKLVHVEQFSVLPLGFGTPFESPEKWVILRMSPFRRVTLW